MQADGNTQVISQEDALLLNDTSVSASQAADKHAFQQLLSNRILTFAARASWKRSALFWMRYAVNPKATSRWWRFVANFSETRALPFPHDELLQKPLTKFLARSLSPAERVTLLGENFEIAARIFSRPSLTRLWQGEAVEMGTIQGKKANYGCTLMLADRCGGRHEGTFAIALTRITDGTTLCTTKFTFIHGKNPDRYTVVIGGMQGQKNAKRAVIDSTRDLSGLRPKEALLMVLQGLTAEGRINHFFAISQERHPIGYRRAKRQKMMTSEMDAYWSERCGTPDNTFGFEVPHSVLTGSDKRSDIKLAFYGIGEHFH